MTRTLRLLVALLAAAGGIIVTETSASAADEIRFVQTSELTRSPNRNTVRIDVPDGPRCTGFLVRGNKVATSAHCIVNVSTGRPFPNLTRAIVRPGSTAGTSPYRSCRVQRTWAHPHFVRTAADTTPGVHWSNPNYDYAVLTLECTYAGYMVMGLRTSTFIGGELPGGTRVGLNGFPQDRRLDGADSTRMVRSTGSARALASYPFHIYYTNYNAPGMSGGPLWTYDRTASCGSTFCAVGINRECAPSSSDPTLCGNGMRRAIRITPRVARDLLSH